MRGSEPGDIPGPPPRPAPPRDRGRNPPLGPAPQPPTRRRQIPPPARIGRHVADFACEAARLVVECDGGQHTPEADAPRTAAIEAAGWHVLRFWNNDVLQNTERRAGRNPPDPTCRPTPHQVRLARKRASLPILSPWERTKERYPPPLPEGEDTKPYERSELGEVGEGFDPHRITPPKPAPQPTAPLAQHQLGQRPHHRVGPVGRAPRPLIAAAA